VKIRKFTLVILIAILIGSLFTGMVSAAEDPRPIKVGLVGSFTGGMAFHGPFLVNGFTLAKDEINAAGGILGHKIEVIKEDDCSVPATGVNAITRLIYKDKVDIILGSISSGITLPMSKVSWEAGVPQLTISLSSSITSQGNPYIFRLAPPASFEGPAMGNFVVNSLKMKKIAVFRANNEAGVSRAGGFVKGLEENSIKPLITQLHNVGDKDFTAQLLAIKKVDPDFVYLAVQDIEGGLIMKQAKQMGLDFTFGGDIGIATDITLKIADKAANGTFVILPFVSSRADSKTHNFLKKFQEKHGRLPDPRDASAYDAAYIIKHAIEMAGSLDKEKIKDALHNIKDFPCLTGTCTYDETGEGFREEYIAIIKDKNFIYCGKINGEGLFVEGGIPK